MASQILLFSGTKHPELTEKIAEKLAVPLGKALISRYSDGETRVEIQENVRGADTYVVQPTSSNDAIMEALLIVDALKRASAENITLVSPYFGYGRQERKNAPRTPISAKLVAVIMEASGITRLLTLELHNSAIQGFFNVPVDHLFIKPVFAEYFKESFSADVIISPDAGGVERARVLAKHFECGLAIIDKRREKPNESRVMHIIGEVKDKDCLIIDDIVDTGGSIVNATKALMDHGAKSVSAAITHAVLSGKALESIDASQINKLIVSDSLPLKPQALKSSKIIQVSIAELMAKAILRIHQQSSVSSLFL